MPRTRRQPKPDDLESPYLSAKQTATMLKVSLVTIYRLANRQEIPAVRFGGSWRFHRARVEAWVKGEVTAMNGHQGGHDA